jgi:hypothetical protein
LEDLILIHSPKANSFVDEIWKIQRTVQFMRILIHVAVDTSFSDRSIFKHVGDDSGDDDDDDDDEISSRGA